MLKLSVGGPVVTLSSTTDEQTEACKPLNDWEVVGDDAQALVAVLKRRVGESEAELCFCNTDLCNREFIELSTMSFV